jgi:hypothetical protein
MKPDDHSRTPKNLNERIALDLLRKPGHLLCLLHTKTGRDFFVVPGGPVTEAVARKILTRLRLRPTRRVERVGLRRSLVRG